MSVHADQLSRSRIPFADEYYDRLVYERDTLGRFRLKPNQSLPHVSINRLGYRGNEFSGDETILLLGDSVTFGVGVSGDETRFPRFLELASGGRVADASVRAYRVSQQFVQLPGLLEQLPSIKKAIVWFGFVDFAYWVIHNGRIEGAFQMDIKYANLSRWKRWLSKLSKPADAAPSIHLEHGDISALVLHVMRYLTAIRDLCAGRGIEAQLILQPFVRERPQDPTLRAITDYYDGRTKAKCGIGWYDAARRFAEELRLACQSRKLPFLDMQGWIQETDFLDQVHLKEEAHLQLANQFAKGSF